MENNKIQKNLKLADDLENQSDTERLLSDELIHNINLLDGWHTNLLKNKLK